MPVRRGLGPTLQTFASFQAAKRALKTATVVALSAEETLTLRVEVASYDVGIVDLPTLRLKALSVLLDGVDAHRASLEVTSNVLKGDRLQTSVHHPLKTSLRGNSRW